MEVRSSKTWSRLSLSQSGNSFLACGCACKVVIVLSQIDKYGWNIEDVFQFYLLSYLLSFNFLIFIYFYLYILFVIIIYFIFLACGKVFVIVLSQLDKYGWNMGYFFLRFLFFFFFFFFFFFPYHLNLTF